MRASGLLRFASAVTVIATLASCGDSTAPKTVDVKADSLIGIMNDVGGLGSPIVSIGGGTMMGPMSNARCSYSAANQRFECSPQTMNGVTTTMWYQYLDASNKPLSAYTSATVNAIRTHTKTNGTITEGTGSQAVSITIDGESDQTMGGLLGATQTLTGTSSQSFSFPGASAVTLAMTMNLTLPARGSTGYPSGTIVMTITEPGTANETMTMTFNGTSVVTISYSTGGSCTMDLSKPGDPGTCTGLYASRSQRIPASAISGGVRWPPRNSR